MIPGGDPDLPRALAFMRGMRRKTARRIEELPGGFAVFADELPAVWDLNLVWIDTVPEELGADELAAWAERVQGAAGLAHRRIELAREEDGERLAAGFEDLGWVRSRLMLMADRRSPERQAAGVDVREIDADAVRRFAERHLRTDPEGFPEDVVLQIAQLPFAYERAGARFFGVEADGEIVASVDLYQEGATAQLESLITDPEHRNRGYASALLLHGLREAVAVGATLVFLQPEEDDWPKELYAKLGWDTIGRLSAFTRHPPE